MNSTARDTERINLARHGPDRIHIPALIASIIASFSAEVLLVRAGERTPLLLRALMGLWVLGPFFVLWTAVYLSLRWSRPVRMSISWVLLAIALATMIVYAADALGPPRTPRALVFVVIPPTSLVLAAVAVPALARVISNRSRRAA